MKKLVILLAAALTFNSCSDSFLDLSNPSALSPSVYPKSMADMETIVTSVYANMVAVPLYGKRVMAKGTFCVDHTVDMAWTGDEAVSNRSLRWPFLCLQKKSGKL